MSDFSFVLPKSYQNPSFYSISIPPLLSLPFLFVFLILQKTLADIKRYVLHFALFLNLPLPTPATKHLDAKICVFHIPYQQLNDFFHHLLSTQTLNHLCILKLLSKFHTPLYLIQIQ